MRNSIKDCSIWITWEHQTRNLSASSYLGIPLFEITDSSSPRILRYIKSIAKTLKILNTTYPRFVFAQNPSIILALLVIFTKKVKKYKVIVDAHNSGVHGPERNQKLIRFLNEFVIRNADAVIVTNHGLSKHIKDKGGKPIVLPDPLPSFGQEPHPTSALPKAKVKALCITSWNDDEPFLEILSATERFTDNIDFYFSGNYKRATHLANKDINKNVKLLGFVDKKIFIEHLLSSDFCIDLTERMDCMVCGAYESIAAEKPVILSDTQVQRDYFKKGVVFCRNNRDSISSAISRMVENLEKYKEEALILKNSILECEAAKKQSILDEISEI